MTLPGETEAGSAGMQPCRGIAWRAHRNDLAGRGSSPFALFPKTHRIGRPLCLENPRPEGAEYSLAESGSSPFHAEPEQHLKPPLCPVGPSRMSDFGKGCCRNRTVGAGANPSGGSHPVQYQRLASGPAVASNLPCFQLQLSRTDRSQSRQEETRWGHSRTTRQNPKPQASPTRSAMQARYGTTWGLHSAP